MGGRVNTVVKTKSHTLHLSFSSSEFSSYEKQCLNTPRSTKSSFFAFQINDLYIENISHNSLQKLHRRCQALWSNLCSLIKLFLPAGSSGRHFFLHIWQLQNTLHPDPTTGEDNNSRFQCGWSKNFFLLQLLKSPKGHDK